MSKVLFEIVVAFKIIIGNYIFRKIGYKQINVCKFQF